MRMPESNGGMRMNPPNNRILTLSLATVGLLVACTDDVPDDTITLEPATETGDGDPGDGDPDPGDGDPGDGDPGDGDPGDGDPGDGDPGDGDPMAETCDDGIQNQDETDVDCGGMICGTCKLGDSCDDGSDCDSGMCLAICVECIGDQDCDFLDEPCAQGSCNVGTCELAAANNGDACDNGDPCMDSGECMGGDCIELPTDCTDFDSDCTMGYCDDMTDQCEVMNINDNMPCSDAVGCVQNPTCMAGVCDEPNGGPLFYDEFTDNGNGWTLDTNWEIGPALAGCGDPGMDNSPSNDNGLAGVVLGGCAPGVLHDYYCLTSPVVDTSNLQSAWMTYYRHLWSDYTPYMKNILQVWDGNQWVLLFETLGFPETDDGMWMYFGYDVTMYRNANMQFRWCYNIQDGGVFDRGSWNIDDVTIAAAECNGAD